MQGGFLIGWLYTFVYDNFGTTVFPKPLIDFDWDYNPFNDVSLPHPTPTEAVVLVEFIEAIFFTLVGVVFLGWITLDLKDEQIEEKLLSEAQDLIEEHQHIYMHHCDRKVTKDILGFVASARASVHFLNSVDAITLKGIGVYVGLTVELLLHVVIELVDNSILNSASASNVNTSGHDAYNTVYYDDISHRSLSSDSDSNSNDYHSSLSSYESSYYADNTYDVPEFTSSENYAIKCALELAFGFVVAALAIGILYVKHGCKWKISENMEADNSSDDCSHKSINTAVVQPLRAK
jgi:hypothetical protein